MNCTQHRDELEAFADGELNAAQHGDAIVHFESCASCRARIDEIRRIKVALARTWPVVQVPDHVRARIESSIAVPTQERAGAITQDDTRPNVIDERQAVGASDRTWVIFSVGTAIAALLAVVIWLGWPQRSALRPTVTVIPASTVADVRERHTLCVTNSGLSHHAEGLSKDLGVIAAQLSRALELKVIAPDLSASGFDLIGADVCGIGLLSASHVLYRSIDSGKMLSVFTTRRLERLGVGTYRRGARDYYTSTDRGLCVLAWHDGPQTHLTCGPLKKDELVTLMEIVQATFRDRGTRAILAAARS